jgi:hypothetical protein
MQPGVVKAIRGLIVLLIGGAISLISYSSAASGKTPGGTYFIMGGALIYGGWLIVSGLWQHYRE